MLDKVIIKQPQEVRDSSYVTEDKIFIPKDVRKKDILTIVTSTDAEFELDEDTKFYLSSLSKDRVKQKTIYDLLTSGGR